MFLRVIGIVCSFILLFTVSVRLAGDESEKIQIPLNKFIKWLFGFKAYGKKRYGLKSIVFQSGNFLGTSLYLIFLLQNNIELAVKSYDITVLASLAIGGVSTMFRN